MKNNKKNKALLVIDCQYDFMPGGSLPVPRGDEILPEINRQIYHHDLVIFTRDFHPSNHKSFASQHKEKNEFDMISLNGIDQVLWPDHCIQNQHGSDLHNDIKFENCKEFYIFKKGMDSEVDSYSGFYDNGSENSTGLSEFLKEKEITEVNIVGLALDFCCKFTALDAIKEGFNTNIILEGTRSINKDLKVIINELKKGGVKII